MSFLIALLYTVVVVFAVGVFSTYIYRLPLWADCLICGTLGFIGGLVIFQ